MKCHACGRALSNDEDAQNFGLWTATDPRWVYCAPDKIPFSDDAMWGSWQCERVTFHDHRAARTGEGQAWTN